MCTLTRMSSVAFCLPVAVLSLTFGTEGVLKAAGPQLPERIGDVQLLKMPYPFRAALTVCSDTHATPVETFEAVHRLVNIEERIRRGSSDFERLFKDPEILEGQKWKEGITGFGLPFADTFWLYDSSIGVFAGLSQDWQAPLQHSHEGQSFSAIIDRWMKRGWVGPLHAMGEGPIPRAASAHGLEWVKAMPHRKSRVYVNHSIAVTPTCIEPDPVAASMFAKNIIKLGTAVLCKVGLEGFAERIASNPYPRPWPWGQKYLMTTLTLLLLGGSVWVVVCLVLKRLRRPVFLLGGVAAVSVAVVTVLVIDLKYAQGDNPDSPFYMADLAREAGFKYHWFVLDTAGYRTHIPNNLMLPERSCEGGRASCLRVVTLDDGSQCIAFGRNYRGVAGYRSLELLTAKHLEALCEKQGTCIIYTHWTVDPRKVFSADAVEGLERVSKLYNQGRIWAASVDDITHYTFVRSFLKFDAYRNDNGLVVDVLGVEDPLEGSWVPTMEDLSGISFACPQKDKLRILVAGTEVDARYYAEYEEGNRRMIQFRLSGKAGEIAKRCSEGA